LSSITKEIIIVKDDVYSFIGSFESKGYRSLSERRSGKDG